MEEHIFTCKECGSYYLRVIKRASEVGIYEQELECECGEAGANPAAERKLNIIDTFETWGYLSEDHTWEFDGPVELLDSEENELDLWVYCQDCYENASSEDWETADEEGWGDEGSIEHYVRCDGCEREIEFGWSHENGGDRIWPVECADFNPLKCFPEPRYEENWAKEGWLRPID